MPYIVRTALVVAKNDAGSDVYVYAGQPVPSNVPESEIKRLLDGEFIESTDDGDEKPARRGRAKADDAE